MAANNPISVNLGLPATPDIKDKQLFVEFLRVYNAINNLARALDTYSGSTQESEQYWDQIEIKAIRVQNLTKLYPIFSVDVPAGAMINVYNVSGVLHARLASAADNTKPARGFSTAAVSSGDRGEVLLLGANTHLSGLTPGTLYYLSEASLTGQVTETAPVTVGNLIQPVGFAVSSSVLFFNPTLLGDIV